MKDRLDERLGGTLEQRADSIVTPLAYTADDIVRMGRRAARRRAVRAWSAAAGTVTALVLIGVPIMLNAAPHRSDPSVGASTTVGPERPATVTNCTLERLALPSGDAASLVMATDPTGRYIVGRTAHANSTSRFDLLIWDHGALHRADLPGERPIPTDVNTGGVAVGTTESGPGNMQSWVYRDGTATLLPGTRRTEARAISDDGVVVGADAQRPVLWRSTSDAPSALRLPEGAWEGLATDITADGKTILGTLHRPQSNNNRAFVWSADAAPRELPLPVVDGTTAIGAYATAISGDWVTGMAEMPDTSVPVRWNLRTGEVQAFAGFILPGAQISAEGWMTASDTRGHATLLLGQQATLTLPGLPERGTFADVAKAISQDGLLIAGGASAGGPQAAGGTLPVVWHCK
jgi:hypothetical protein